MRQQGGHVVGLLDTPTMWLLFWVSNFRDRCGLVKEDVSGTQYQNAHKAIDGSNIELIACRNGNCLRRICGWQVQTIEPARSDGTNCTVYAPIVASNSDKSRDRPWILRRQIQNRIPKSEIKLRSDDIDLAEKPKNIWLCSPLQNADPRALGTTRSRDIWKDQCWEKPSLVAEESSLRMNLAGGCFWENDSRVGRGIGEEYHTKIRYGRKGLLGRMVSSECNHFALTSHNIGISIRVLEGFFMPGQTWDRRFSVSTAGWLEHTEAIFRSSRWWHTIPGRERRTKMAGFGSAMRPEFGWGFHWLAGPSWLNYAPLNVGLKRTSIASHSNFHFKSCRHANGPNADPYFWAWRVPHHDALRKCQLRFRPPDSEFW